MADRECELSRLFILWCIASQPPASQLEALYPSGLLFAPASMWRTTHWLVTWCITEKPPLHTSRAPPPSGRRRKRSRDTAKWDRPAAMKRNKGISTPPLPPPKKTRVKEFMENGIQSQNHSIIFRGPVVKDPKVTNMSSTKQLILWWK